MMPPPPRKAVLYCRVSSKRQLREGNGLEGQEKRCRDYALAKGYEVIAVFKEQAFTGDLLSRPAMKQLLAFLEEQNEPVVVLIDDLKRFARNVETHFALKVAVVRLGGLLESPSFRFEDTPEGKFVETVIAGAAELERNQNRQQVLNRMRARMELGHWPFRCPPGYITVKHPVHKKTLALDPNKAPLVKEALEGFANGRFPEIMDVQRFLAERGFFRPRRYRAVTTDIQLVNSLLRQVLYTGYLEYAPWDVSLRRGHHPAIINWETYERVQEKLAGRRPVFLRQDSQHDFPLRGFVVCGACGRPYTGSRSTGRRSRRYPYYHCYERRCPDYGKAVPQERLEQDFEALLQPLRARPEVLALAREMLTDLWQERCESWESEQQQAASRASRTQEQIDALVQKLMVVTAPAAVEAIEERIVTLEEERDKLLRQAARTEPPMAVGTAVERVFPLLKNPCQTWKSGPVESQRLVTTLVFTERLPYDRKSGFGTASFSLPYLLLAMPDVKESTLVDYSREDWNLLTDWIQKNEGTAEALLRQRNALSHPDEAMKD